MHIKPLLASLLLLIINAEAAPVHLVDEAPVQITQVSPEVLLIDFGRVAYGNLRLTPSTDVTQAITVHYGEDSKEGRVNRKPPGTVRYVKTTAKLDGVDPIVVAPPVDKRNTIHKKAIHTPVEWGVVLPFRWVEIEGWVGELTTEQIVRQSAFASTWDDDAADFECSNKLLNRIWELCRYSIKATTFAGVYVDGDRERIPYEADAYLNQLSHYTTDHDVRMARDTFDQLMKMPTWPSEWAPHMVFMAYADWMHTGDTKWLAPRYESLKTKMLLERARPDGLIGSNAKQVKRDDIVDWPKGERDSYVFTPVNTVVNAFHLRVLAQMAELADALDKPSEAAEYLQRARATQAVFQDTLFDKASGLYRDGIDTDHSSLHANLFPLAFGIVPVELRQYITEWLSTRGMACSVYAAQYLLEGLFENGADSTAIELMIADNDRSWKHMVESGTTISWEAWDMKYKPNQDWNHAWGAAPANILPNYVLGARALHPGWKTARIRPHTGGLSYAKGKVPTPEGPIMISWENVDTFVLSLTLPNGMNAQVELPHRDGASGVTLNGEVVAAKLVDGKWILGSPIAGKVQFEVK
ncbi:MAG: alpha-L-rhamnosidase C-terminal domain-containing protein [Lentimonas sp.]